MVDALETMVRRIRPYETTPGTADRVFQFHLERIADSLLQNTKQGLKALHEAVEDFNGISLRNIPRKPRVGIVGEILMNYHRERIDSSSPTWNGMEWKSSFQA